MCWVLPGLKSIGATESRRSDRKPEDTEGGGTAGSVTRGTSPRVLCHPRQDARQVLLHTWRAGATPHP